MDDITPFNDVELLDSDDLKKSNKSFFELPFSFFNDYENNNNINTKNKNIKTYSDDVDKQKENDILDQYVKLSEIDNASKNNGMLTKVWGPPLWVGLHAITFGYPEKIDKTNESHKEKRESYYMFFKLLGDVLPCRYCRESYKEFFKELDLKQYLESRKDIVRWLYLIHEKVNDKLKVPDCNRITFYEFTKQYESYRAKCKPDNIEQAEKVKENETKGCVKPLDNTPKRSIINVIKCKEGDVTRRDNAFENWTDTNNNKNYMLIHKKWLILIIMFLFMLIGLYLIFL